jgi:hypothetical protein
MGLLALFPVQIKLVATTLGHIVTMKVSFEGKK